MARTVVVALALASIAGSASLVGRQQHVLDAAKLQSILPGSPPAGFKVDRPPTSSTNQTPFGRVSIAEVSYKTSDDAPRMITVAITDLAEHLAKQAMLMEVSGQTGGGEGSRPVTVHGKYHGLEKLNALTSGGSVSFAVADRFIVEITGTRVDLKVLYSILDAMSLDALEKLT